MGNAHKKLVPGGVLAHKLWAYPTKQVRCP